MGLKAEKLLKSILNEIKNMGLEYEIPKKYLIQIINKFTTNPYPYINRLLIDGYLKEIDLRNYKIISLEYNSEENGENDIINKC